MSACDFCVELQADRKEIYSCICFMEKQILDFLKQSTWVKMDLGRMTTLSPDYALLSAGWSAPVCIFSAFFSSHMSRYASSRWLQFSLDGLCRTSATWRRTAASSSGPLGSVLFSRTAVELFFEFVSVDARRFFSHKTNKKG